jgi:hypothetical protein
VCFLGASPYSGLLVQENKDEAKNVVWQGPNASGTFGHSLIVWMT